MNRDLLRRFLLACTLINVGILALWSVILLLPHAWLYQLWHRWFLLSAEQFDVILFAGLLFYKVLVILFNLVPSLALLIVRRD